MAAILQAELGDKYHADAMATSMLARDIEVLVERTEKNYLLKRVGGRGELLTVVEKFLVYGGKDNAPPTGLLTLARSYAALVARNITLRNTTFDELESAGSEISQLVQRYILTKKNGQRNATTTVFRAIELALLALLFVQGGILLNTARNQARANHGACEQCAGLGGSAGRGHRTQDKGRTPVQDDSIVLPADGLGSHSDLLRLIATANAPIIGIDAEYCVNEWNQKAVALTGFSRDEVLGRPLIDEFIEPRARQSVKDVLTSALQGTPRDDYRFILMTKDERPLHISLNATPRYDVTGCVIGVIGIGQDVSKELTLGADLLRLITTANAPIIGIDVNFCVNEWNEKAVALTGFSRDEVMGRPLIEQFIEPETRDGVRAVLTSATNGIPKENYRFTLMTKLRRPLQILLNATPRYDAAGRVTGVIGIGQDVSKELAQQSDVLRLIAASDVHLAAMTGDMAMLHKYTSQGHLNATDDTGNTPLIWAANAGQTEAVEFLLRLGVDVNHKGFMGNTSLSRVAQRGNVDCVQILLSAGADPNNPNDKVRALRRGQDALYTCVGRLESVLFLRNFILSLFTHSNLPIHPSPTLSSRTCSCRRLYFPDKYAVRCPTRTGSIRPPSILPPSGAIGCACVPFWIAGCATRR